MSWSVTKKIRYPSYVPFSLWHTTLVAAALIFLVVIQQFIHHVLSGYKFEFSWLVVFLRNVSNYGLLILAVPTIALIIKKIFDKTESHLLIWTRLVIGTLLLAILHQSLSLILFDTLYALQYLSNLHLFRPQNVAALGAGFLSSLIQILVVSAVIWGKGYYDRYVKQKEDLARAELRALKMQLQPHFLFNTLNSITSLIDIDPKKAQKMLTQLGFLMREILEHDSQHFISLQSELKYIQTYLEIEHVRYSDRLQLEFDIDEKSKKCEGSIAYYTTTG